MATDPDIVERYTSPSVVDPGARARDLGELVMARPGWAVLAVVPGKHGGWDVAVRIDGAYSSRETAEHMVEHFAHRAAKVEYRDGE